MEVLNISKLTKLYGNSRVLDDISLKLNESDIIGLVGPNGSGKSTFLNIICNLISYQDGSIKIFGRDHQDEQIFHKLSYLKDNSILYPYLTGWDHLSFASSVYHLTKKQINEIIDQLNIRDYIGKRTGEYSLGMKQMLLLALALLNDPSFIILDEPLNGLDPSRIVEVRVLLKELANEGKTILLSSHSLLEVAAVTNHILFLKDGKLFEEYLNSKDAMELENKYLSYFPKT